MKLFVNLKKHQTMELVNEILTLEDYQNAGESFGLSMVCCQRTG